MNNIYKWLRGRILKKLGKRESSQKEVLRNERLFGRGVFPFFKNAKVLPFTPMDVDQNWFSTLTHREKHINEEDLAQDEKYQKYINEFKNNDLFREYIFTYIHSLDTDKFIEKLDFIESRNLITKSQADEQKKSMI